MAGSASAWEEAVSECAHRFSVFSRIALTVKELISLLRRSGRVSAAAVQRRGRAPQVGRERERSTQEERSLARLGGRGGVVLCGDGAQKKWFAMHALRGCGVSPRLVCKANKRGQRQADLRVLAEQAGAIDVSDSARPSARTSLAARSAGRAHAGRAHAGRAHAGRVHPSIHPAHRGRAGPWRQERRIGTLNSASAAQALSKLFCFAATLKHNNYVCASCVAKWQVAPRWAVASTLSSSAP